MPSNNPNRQQQQQREVEAMPSFVNQHFTGKYIWSNIVLFFCQKEIYLFIILLATAHNYIVNNLDELAQSVNPNPQDLKFLQNFLNNPALKDLISVSFFYISVFNILTNTNIKII